MTVEVAVDNRSGSPVDRHAVERIVCVALAAEGVGSGEVGVAFVSEHEMAELNGRHRGTPEPTDVLSFPLDGRDELPDGVPRQLGDLIVCPQVAAAAGTPMDTLLVHGALHLLGWDHEAGAGEMLARQEALLEEMRGAAEPA